MPSDTYSSFELEDMGFYVCTRIDIIKTSRGKCIQRKECMCIAEKTELLTERKQCKHGYL
jgi:hypothetical protein